MLISKSLGIFSFNRDQIQDQDQVEELVNQWKVKLQDNFFFERGDATKFLFVHQTWQKQLLSLYGNEICLLDATYRTCRYARSLFLLVVPTNIIYTVVGTFPNRCRGCPHNPARTWNISEMEHRMDTIGIYY